MATVRVICVKGLKCHFQRSLWLWRGSLSILHLLLTSGDSDLLAIFDTQGFVNGKESMRYEQFLKQRFLL